MPELVTRPYARAFEEYAVRHPEVLCLSADLTSSCEIDGFRDRHPGECSAPIISTEDPSRLNCSSASGAMRPVSISVA